MGLYEEMKSRKESGEMFSFDDITPDELKQMFIDESVSDRSIAELYDVTKSKVAYRRKKYGINISNAILENILQGNIEEAAEFNRKCREDILREENINLIARAITHFAFRNGPVEDMHADPNSQLSQEDMKTLNKYMVNRIAYIMELIMGDRWFEFSQMVSQHAFFGQDWDKAEPDDGGTREMLQWNSKGGNRNRQADFTIHQIDDHTASNFLMNKET